MELPTEIINNIFSFIDNKDKDIKDYEQEYWVAIRNLKFWSNPCTYDNILDTYRYNIKKPIEPDRIDFNFLLGIDPNNTQSDITFDELYKRYEVQLDIYHINCKTAEYKTITYINNKKKYYRNLLVTANRFIYLYNKCSNA